MKLLGHLVRADVRRFRMLLAGWVLIEIADTVFTGVQPLLTGDPRTSTAMGLLAMVLFFTRWLGMVVIVALVVQTHPLVGSDAFWMTRPIPPRALFASKVFLLATTFLAVPALCEVVLMAAFRVPAAEVVLVAIQTMLFQSLWVAIVMALAAITRNLARFVLVAGAVLVSLILLMSIGIAVTMRELLEGPRLHEVTDRVVSGPAEDVAMLLLLIAAVAVPIVIQYATRSTRFSAGAGVVALAGAFLIVWIWPWEGQALPVPEWAGRESALGVIAASPTGEFRPHERWDNWNRPEDWQVGHAQLRLRGVEEGWLATARLADSTMQVDGGATLRTLGNGYSSTVPFELVDDFPNRVVMRHVLGVGRVAGVSQGVWIAEGVPAIVVSQADFRKYSAASGTYRGRFLLDLERVEIAATLPLQVGAEYFDRRSRVTIEGIIPQAQAASIRVRQVIVSTMFHSKALPDLSFYLRNRDAAVAIAGSSGGMGAASVGLSLPMLYGMSYAGSSMNGFHVTGDYLRFSGSHPQEDPVDISPEWLSRAELVIVRTVQAGSVTRTVEIPGFEIRAAPPGPASVVGKYLSR
jgi:hypothetical protein